MIARVFTFHAAVNNASRSTLRIPLLNGPALIAHARVQSTSGSFDQSFEFGEGNTLETNVAIGLAKPWVNQDFQQLLRSAGIINTAHQGFIIPTGALEIFAGIPIYREHVELLMAILNNSGAAQQYTGYVKIWEEVPEEMLRCFIDP